MTGGEPEEDGTSYGFRWKVCDILFSRASSSRANNFRRFEVGASLRVDRESPKALHKSRFFDGKNFEDFFAFPYERSVLLICCVGSKNSRLACAHLTGDFSSREPRTRRKLGPVSVRKRGVLRKEGTQRRSGRNARLLYFARASLAGRVRRSLAAPSSDCESFAHSTALPALAYHPALAPCRRSPLPSGASSRRAQTDAGTRARPASALPAGARRSWRTPGPATTWTRLPRPGSRPRTRAGSRRPPPPPLPCATPPRRCVSGSRARAERSPSVAHRVCDTNTRKYLD